VRHELKIIDACGYKNPKEGDREGKINKEMNLKDLELLSF
jgi:hypothetical protein